MSEHEHITRSVDGLDLDLDRDLLAHEHAAAGQHADREVAHRIDERGDRPAVELLGAGTPLELGPQFVLNAGDTAGFEARFGKV